MLAYITWGVDPNIFEIGSFELNYYAICWVLAFMSSYIVLYRIFMKEGRDIELLVSLTFYVFIGTFLGARLAHCFFYEPQYYLANPLEILLPIERAIDGGWDFIGFRGLASHGGAIGIMISLLLFARLKRFNIWDLSDKLGLVAPLAGGFIRIGNLFNSEIIGMESTLPWAFRFTRVDGIPRHPSQLYEAIAYFGIFFVLYYFYKRRRESHQLGFLLGLSITLIFGARFILEYTKEVQESFELAMRAAIGMDMGQLLSIPFIVAGVVIMILKSKKKEI